MRNKLGVDIFCDPSSPILFPLYKYFIRRIILCRHHLGSFLENIHKEESKGIVPETPSIAFMKEAFQCSY